jgi:eukaryotic-like serine/threonine-protein kinase
MGCSRPAPGPVAGRTSRGQRRKPLETLPGTYYAWVRMIGETLGSYRVVSKIGEGGMGVVYLAAHTFLERKAAVKVLLPAFSSDPEVVERFVNEARAATVIHHPGIVQVFDFGKLANGSAYLVMEYLEGESLDARLKRLGRMSVFDALRITHHCASALAAAHQAGIVHRDLKPENIFLVPDPQIDGGERAKILDFGIAKLTGDQQRGSVKTRTGSVMGTPTYMAPEQCLGAGEVDHRADIYALACVLFHLLCGRPPFVGQGVGELLVAHVREPAPWARGFNPEVPPVVDALLQRALAKEPGERFASMAEFATALAALAGQARSGSWSEIPGLPVAASPHTPSPGLYPGPGPYPGTNTGLGSRPGMGSAPRMLTGSTIGAAAAQNLTHGTLPGTGRKRAVIIAVVAATTTVALGILLAVLPAEDKGSGDKGSGEAPTLPLDPPRAAASPPTQPEPQTPPVTIPDQPDEPELQPVQPIEVEVTSEPAGAKVFALDSDKELGVTPYTYEAPPSDGKITLRLELDGYKTAEISFRGDRNSMAQLALQKESKRDGRRPPRNSKPEDEFGYR